MLRDLKILSLPIEYCAFMVAIMMTRYNVDESTRVQSSVESIVSKLNSLQYGDKVDFQVTRAALHQGIFLFKKVLQSLGYEVTVKKNSYRISLICRVGREDTRLNFQLSRNYAGSRLRRTGRR